MKLAMLAAAAIIALTGGAFAQSEASSQYGDCKVTGAAGSVAIKPLKPDTLIVGTVLPNPGWWNGSSPNNIRSGFEYCLAAQIAHRAGLNHLEIHNMAWDQFISGAATGYDIAMGSVTITDSRRAVMDFSVPYFSSDLGVATKANSPVTADNIRDKRIGVIQGTTGGAWVINTLKAKSAPALFQNSADLFTALSANQVDAVVIDTTLALTGVKRTNGYLMVAGQYKADQPTGIVMPKGSPNEAAVNKVVDDLKADGSLARMTDDYLAPMFGGNPDKIPFWSVQ